MLKPAALALAVAAALASPASGQTGIRVTGEFLVGRWGDEGDCNRAVIFRSDGVYRSTAGGEGRWRLAGDRLTLSRPRGNTVLRVRAISRTRIEIVNPDGSRGSSQRCPAR